MSLFGNLPSAKNGEHADALPAALANRSLVPPPSILRSRRTRSDTLDTVGNSGKTSGKSAGAVSANGLFSAFGEIEDEYDPAVPNEYIKAKEDQEKAVLEAEMEARKAAEQRQAVCCHAFSLLAALARRCIYHFPRSWR